MEDTVLDKKRMQVTIEDIEALKKITRVQKLIDCIKGKKILFYGGGRHTDYILQCCV